MTTKTVKVGDVVAWDEVPDMTLTLDIEGNCVVRTSVRFIPPSNMHRPASDKWVNYLHGEDVWRAACRNSSNARHPLRIVALDITGNETADELRALAEAFERNHPAA